MDFCGIQDLVYGVFNSRAKFPKAIRTEPRLTEVYEIELFTEDQTGTCYLHKDPVALQRGTMICAKPGQIRSSRLHFKCLYIHIQTQDPGLQGMLNKLPNNCTLVDIEPFVALFHKLLQLDAERFPEERLMIFGTVLEIIYRLSQATLISGKEQTLLTHRQQMQSIERYIRSNLSRPLDLETLARQANLSASYFHKIFCAHFEATPGEFVLNCRISAAKTLLVTQDIPLSEIAAQCGFTSQSYFNYRFKQIVGQTPLQYRKAALSRLQV